MTMQSAKRLTKLRVRWGFATPAARSWSSWPKSGKPVYDYPRGFKGETHLDFTFSGLKTAVINHMHNMDQKGERYDKADIAASFQREAVSFLADNTFEAAAREGIKKIGIAGGVSSNNALRAAFQKKRRRKRHRALSARPALLHRQCCDDRLRSVVCSTRRKIRCRSTQTLRNLCFRYCTIALSNQAALAGSAAAVFVKKIVLNRPGKERAAMKSMVLR